MAKNLKLNVKNAQLAEALKLGKITKPASSLKKKKTTEAEAPTAEAKVEAAPVKPEAAPVAPPPAPAPAPVVEAAPAPKPAAAPKPAPAAEVQPPAPPVQREPVREATPAPQAAQAPRASHAPQAPQQPSSEPRREYQSQPYREPYRGGQRPHYQQGRPVQQPSGDRPAAPAGDRPHAQLHREPRDYNRPYTPRPDRPPGTGYAPRPPGTGYNRPYQATDRPQGGYPPRQPYTPGGRPPFNRNFGRPAIPPMTPREMPKKEEPSKRAPEFKKPATKDYRDVKQAHKKPSFGEKTFDSRDKQGLRDSDESWRKKRPTFKHHIQEEAAVARPRNLKVRIPITVKDLASEMKLKASELISKLFMQGAVLTLNDFLTDETTIQLLGHEFGCEITIDTTQEDRLKITEKTIKEEIQASNPEDLIIRAPVVAFMGHVDHGKTSLIDAIRKTNMASEEAGAITQHIGAFRCHTAVGDLTILDTPGHEAFSAMRARGADITDIIVLVVAGDEGIRAQTVEAIQQARSASVPIVVAINKCDKPNFNAENVYRQLSDNELLPEAWGGSVITINCSAVTGAGIKELLEMLALQSEILELKANPKSRARGTVVESEMHKGMGGVATILVQNGTLRINDPIVFAQHWARVKTMQDENGKDLEEAGPSTPVKITGLSGLPVAGSELIVVKSEREARELAEERSQGQKNLSLIQRKKGSLENLLHAEATKSEKKLLPVILRADVQGSLEALKNSLQKIESSKVDLIIVSDTVGEISESDIQLAAASKSTILGFHTKIESRAEGLIKELKVTVRLHDIIYHAVDDIKELMKNLLDKIPQENETGVAIVKAVFKASQLGTIAGCQVTEGLIKRNNQVRVIRDGNQIWKGSISSLKRVKEDVREVSKGLECGILLQNYNDFKEGDILQAFEVTYLEQSL